jgi:hypothetical protein
MAAEPAAAREMAAGVLRQKAKELFKRGKHAGGWARRRVLRRRRCCNQASR